MTDEPTTPLNKLAQAIAESTMLQRNTQDLERALDEQRLKIQRLLGRQEVFAEGCLPEGFNLQKAIDENYEGLRDKVQAAIHTPAS